MKRLLAIYGSLLALVAMSSVAQASPLQFTYVSQSYPVNQDTWSPWGSYGVTALGSKITYVSNSSFFMHSVGGASGAKSCTLWTLPWCEGYGAGGYRKQYWDITLQLAGDIGTVPYLYFDSHFWGDADVGAIGIGNAKAWSLYDLTIDAMPGGNELLHQTDYSEAYANVVGFEIEVPFDNSVNNLYIGSLAVGDKLHITGRYEVNANAYSAALGNFYARENSSFEFGITALEAPLPTPAPEPGTLALLALGLVGFTSWRARVK